MKKRTVCAILVAMILALALSGCASTGKSGNNIAAESRNGVARVYVTYEDCDVYVYNVPSKTSEFLETRSVSFTGTAFGVGTPGKETDVFVTNTHVIEKELNYAVQIDDENVLLYVGTVTGIYLLKDDYAVNSNNVLDKSRAIPCRVPAWFSIC